MRQRRKMLTTGALRSRKLAGITLAEEAVYWRIYMASDNYGTMLADPWDVMHEAFPGKAGAGEKVIGKAIDALVEAGLIERWLDPETDKEWMHLIGHDQHQQSTFLARRGPRRTPMPPSMAAHYRGDAPSPNALDDTQEPSGDAVLVRTHADARPLMSMSTSTSSREVVTVGSQTSLEPVDTDRVADKATIDGCFAAYCQLWGKVGPLQLALTKKRRDAIRKAIEKHGKQRVWLAIQGHHADPWRHEGGLERNDIVKLLRDDNIERGIERAAKAVGLVPAGAAPAQTELERMGY